MADNQSSTPVTNGAPEGKAPSHEGEGLTGSLVFDCNPKFAGAPEIDPSAIIAPSAIVRGNVVIGSEVVVKDHAII